MIRTFSNSKSSERLSRRDLLLGASSGVAVSLAGAALPVWGQSPQAGVTADRSAPKPGRIRRFNCGDGEGRPAARQAQNGVDNAGSVAAVA